MEATLENVVERLKETGLPVAYIFFPEKEAPPLPYICYLTQGNNNFPADGHVYFSARRIQIELYTGYKQPDIEDKVEAALSPYFWEKSEEYIDSEQCYQILYELEV